MTPRENGGERASTGASPVRGVLRPAPRPIPCPMTTMPKDTPPAEAARLVAATHARHESAQRHALRKRVASGELRVAR